MVVRKNIALEEKHLRYLEPLLEKNNNNLSAAMRDAIEFSNLAMENFETLKEAAEFLTQKQRELSPLEESIKSGKNVVMGYPTLLWLLKYANGILLDREVLEEILDPISINTISELDSTMNRICQDFGWQINISLFSMDNLNPDSVTLLVSSGNEMIREFAAVQLAQFFAYNMNLDVEIVHKRATSLRVDFKKVEDGAEFKGLEEKFGYNHDVMNEILRRPKFWRTMITIHMITNYNIVSMCSGNFESALAGTTIQDTSIIESYVKKHIFDIPYPEFIETIKLLHENMGIVEKIEYPDMDTIKVYHSYKDKKAVLQMANFYKFILEANGQHFDSKYSSSLIILERTKK